jgi:hypothetical protein
MYNINLVATSMLHILIILNLHTLNIDYDRTNPKNPIYRMFYNNEVPRMLAKINMNTLFALAEDISSPFAFVNLFGFLLLLDLLLSRLHQKA